MKRFSTVLLCGALGILSLAGFGGKVEAQEAEGTSYEETIPFSMTNYFSVWCYSAVSDYKDDVYQYIVDRFNIEPDVWACTDGENEKTRMWINGGTMPDVMWWESFNLDEYYTYVDQGLLQPLPDGWETRWPNLYKVVQSSGMEDLIKVDGKTYVIPHAITGLYSPSEGGAIESNTLYYRKDWAKEVGMEDFGSNSQVTISELREYLEKVREAGLTERLLNSGSKNLRTLFYSVNGANWGSWGNMGSDFKETENGFEWIPASEEVKNAITMMQDWYQAGLIDPEFYVDDEAASISYSQFANGQLAAYYWAGAIVDAQTVANSCKESFAGDDVTDIIGFAHVTNDEGVSYCSMIYNYWGTHVFNPDTDEKTMVRILDLMDWISSEEGFTTYCMGVPGVDWEFDEEGNFKLLNPDAHFRRDIDVFAYFGYCQDDFAYSGNQEGLTPSIVENILGIYEVKRSGNHMTISDNFTRYSSDTKDNYSMDSALVDKMVEIVVEGLDVESTWTQFVEDNRNIWEPLLTELNETYGY